MKKIVVMGRDGNGEGHIELLCNFAQNTELTKVVEHCFKCQSPSRLTVKCHSISAKCTF